MFCSRLQARETGAEKGVDAGITNPAGMVEPAG
jgi:hypothetical protein